METDMAAALQDLHARICKAIADPKRLMIINELRGGPLSVGEICHALGLTQSNASQHLAILRERGIVSATRAGTSVYYQLRSQKVVMAVDLLREFLADELAEQGRLSGAFE